MARTKSILLVDQDNAIVKFVTLILENEGYRVFTARDGDDPRAVQAECRRDRTVWALCGGQRVRRHVSQVLGGRGEPSQPVTIHRTGVDGRRRIERSWRAAAGQHWQQDHCHDKERTHDCDS